MTEKQEQQQQQQQQKPSRMSHLISPLFIPTTPNQPILLSPGHHTPGWLTHLSTLLPSLSPSTALNSPANYPLLANFLTHPKLIQECLDFGRVLPSTVWTAEDEERLCEAEGEGFVTDLVREVEVRELVEFWRGRGWWCLEGFDQRAGEGLRVVRIGGPFEVRVDEGGDEFVLEG